KNRSTSERVVWQDVQQLERELAEHDLSQSVIPIQFQIPYESRETSDENPSSKIIWRLEVRAAVTGTDYAAAFDIPVFKTSESSPDFQMDTSAIDQYRKERKPAQVLADSGVRVEHMAGGKRWMFPPARHIGSALGLTLFLLIWLGAIVLMIHLGAPLFFPIIFGLFGLLLVWGVLDLWLWCCRIDGGSGSLTVTSGILGLRKTRAFTADQIDSIQPTLGMQMGNKLFYGLKLATRDGAKHTIGKRLLIRSDAELLADEILQVVTG
ncbi:MAG: hypothetical protein OES79_12555, partial [Planctomycetota bacterium]|nr:hypothetical protein [Planctomycetota bacterium]